MLIRIFAPFGENCLSIKLVWESKSTAMKNVDTTIKSVLTNNPGNDVAILERKPTIPNEMFVIFSPMDPINLWKFSYNTSLIVGLRLNIICSIVVYVVIRNGLICSSYTTGSSMIADAIIVTRLAPTSEIRNPIET